MGLNWDPNWVQIGQKWGHNGSRWIQMADIGQNGFEIGSVFGEAQAYAGTYRVGGHAVL